MIVLQIRVIFVDCICPVIRQHTSQLANQGELEVLLGSNHHVPDQAGDILAGMQDAACKQRSRNNSIA